MKNANADRAQKEKEAQEGIPVYVDNWGKIRPVKSDGSVSDNHGLPNGDSCMYDMKSEEILSYRKGLQSECSARNEAYAKRTKEEAIKEGRLYYRKDILELDAQSCECFRISDNRHVIVNRHFMRDYDTKFFLGVAEKRNFKTESQWKNALELYNIGVKNNLRSIENLWHLLFANSEQARECCERMGGKLEYVTMEQLKEEFKKV